jgi:hypothetical protein
MGEDFDDHRRIVDGGDDLQGAAAVGAVFNIDIEDPFEEPGPAHARRLSLTLGVIERGLGDALCRASPKTISRRAEAEKDLIKYHSLSESSTPSLG